MQHESSWTTPSAFGSPPYPTYISVGSSSTMLTPAISDSSTSSPFAIRCQASSTELRGPLFLYSWPLAEEITTGGVALRTSTLGPWPNAAAGTLAATDAAVPAFTNSRRLSLSLISLPLSVTRGP